MPTLKSYLVDDEAHVTAIAPIIVTATMGEPDFSILDDLRQRHFPIERNYLRAHLTMFHHVPPSTERELRDLLAMLARQASPAARLAGLVNLGRGVAFRVESAELAAIRAMIADRFWTLLTPQDRSPWRPHVTVQNKVAAVDAQALLASLAKDFAPRPLRISGLAAWWYRGGPWEPLAAFKFR